ncbi:unnamed protein product [Protopolystoma xenopodis]|uniref:Uncharacterized protein n=1 Tax=Protopolystoma xenopodis TaxID=117903 RepID=A0A3S5BVW1_9PLAT|nr:unnamed protein product [Protopolystoma xenopodis]
MIATPGPFPAVSRTPPSVSVVQTAVATTSATLHKPLTPLVVTSSATFRPTHNLDQLHAPKTSPATPIVAAIDRNWHLASSGFPSSILSEPTLRNPVIPISLSQMPNISSSSKPCQTLLSSDPSTSVSSSNNYLQPGSSIPTINSTSSSLSTASGAQLIMLLPSIVSSAGVINSPVLLTAPSGSSTASTNPCNPVNNNTTPTPHISLLKALAPSCSASFSSGDRDGGGNSHSPSGSGLSNGQSSSSTGFSSLLIQTRRREPLPGGLGSHFTVLPSAGQHPSATPTTFPLLLISAPSGASAAAVAAMVSGTSASNLIPVPVQISPYSVLTASPQAPAVSIASANGTLPILKVASTEISSTASNMVPTATSAITSSSSFTTKMTLTASNATLNSINTPSSSITLIPMTPTLSGISSERADLNREFVASSIASSEVTRPLLLCSSNPQSRLLEVPLAKINRNVEPAKIMLSLLPAGESNGFSLTSKYKLINAFNYCLFLFVFLLSPVTSWPLITFSLLWPYY